MRTVISTLSSARMSAAYETASSEFDILNVSRDELSV